MRDHQKINSEIRLLIYQFGEERICWESQGRFVMVRDWPLPSNLNKRKSHVIVLIPENYGNGAPLRDAFLEPEIKAYHRGKNKYQEIPHYHIRYPYAQVKLGTKEGWQKNGWQYLCLHEKNGSDGRSSILNYLVHLYKFLSEPFRDWQKTFSSYGDY